ncbi:MAG: VWA domain-containing protein [Chloroflexaceae bacterium]|nr:VWA domain-containing protein [Chloroflexaceae bacterium]
MMKADIQLQWKTSRSVLPASGEQQLVYILLQATPQGVVHTDSKLPLNLCLVLDRSSSMRGERLAQVKEATHRIIDHMSNGDYFSLITFNDRAEVVIPAQRVLDKNDLKLRVSAIEAAGGTEMATGLAMAVQEIRRVAIVRGISRVMLLTDGRTYGDEGRCVQIARLAQERRIGVTVLGIGTEWNEDLLETMAAHENSRAHYITSPREVTQVFAEELQRMYATFAQGVKVYVKVRSEGVLRSLDRVQPFIAPVGIGEEQPQTWIGNLGDWTSGDVHSFLLEVMVPPLPEGEQSILQLAIRYTVPDNNAQQQVAATTVQIPVVSPEQAEKNTSVDSNVKRWLEKVVAYRLQARAWQAVADGNIEEATTKLRMAGTRLFESGETELARTIEQEATKLLQSGTTSAEGRKRIKYGTRGLMGAK